MNHRNGLLLCSTAALLALAAPGHGAVAPGPGPTAAAGVQSYADLLAPIPDAPARLQADDAARAQQPRPLQLAQYHHHHHAYHHHHHHHHHNFPFGLFFGPRVAPAPYCYWTWGQPYWNGYAWVRPRVRVCG